MVPAQRTNARDRRDEREPEVEEPVDEDGEDGGRELRSDPDERERKERLDDSDSGEGKRPASQQSEKISPNQYNAIPTKAVPWLGGCRSRCLRTATASRPCPSAPRQPFLVAHLSQ